MFLNQHTVNETKDLIRAKAMEIANLKAAAATYGNVVDSSWTSDFANLSSRFNTAQAVAQAAMTALNMPFVSDDIQTAETAYQGVLHSVIKNEGQVQAGDLQDLWNRLTLAQGKPIAENAASLQPVYAPKGSDVDLNNLQRANAVIANIPTPGKNPYLFGGLLVGGGLAALLALKIALK
jgi:hypothetical protein